MSFTPEFRKLFFYEFLGSPTFAAVCALTGMAW